MITYLTVIFRNYKLLAKQLEIFNTLNISDKLLIVDNTPTHERQFITLSDNMSVIIRDNNGGEFDGVSHGEAIDFGIAHVDTPYVCIFDSDFFFKRNLSNYAIENFSLGYKAIGAEFWNSSTLGIYDKFEHLFSNVPCCFCGFYEMDLIKNLSWVITSQEIDMQTSYIEVGYRIRKYINENNILSIGWKCLSDDNNNLFRYYAGESLMGIHLVAGSHRNINFNIESI
jgi:hypothetical protein